MDLSEFQKMFEVEETNWWYRGRRKLVTRWIRDLHRERGHLRILDIASATGMSFKFLREFGDVHGVDISEETIRLCRQRGVDGIIQGNAELLPFRDGSFDVVMALDALEHFDDDHAAIAEIRRVAKPNALVLVTVPAYMFLWSSHDEAYQHKRRYTRGELGRKLRQHGLQPKKLSYYSMTLLPAVYFMRKTRSKLRPKQEDDHSDFFLPLPGPVEALLYGIMSSEIGLMRAVSLPFGVSLFCASSPAPGSTPSRPPQPEAALAST
jgi:ubiquinone/menaquinone biosynthesis C-methylase UbiE